VAASRTRARLRTAVIIGVGAVAGWFAVEGGEYGTADLVRQRYRRDRVVAELDTLTRVVDSLRRHRQRVLNDAATQERIAREEFGMIRGKELLYRFAEPDSL
jgi:cell division protein FtsB